MRKNKRNKYIQKQLDREFKKEFDKRLAISYTNNFDPYKNGPTNCEKHANFEYSRYRRSAKYVKKYRNILARNPTPAEKKIMGHLNALKIPFDFQKIIPLPQSSKIVDFFIPHALVILEVDGASHKDRQKQDKERQETILSEYPHFRFVRFTNDEAFSSEMRDRLLSLVS